MHRYYQDQFTFVFDFSTFDFHIHLMERKTKSKVNIWFGAELLGPGFN